MTPAGHQALKEGLARLKVQRPKISKEIEVAREHGDLRENAEYHAAKDKQGLVEAQIRELEDKIARADVIDPSQLGGPKVKFGAKVTLEDIESGKILVFKLVGPEESDLESGTISVTSPVARACLNREVGDEVRVRAPGGQRTYEISSIDWD